jgi:hypothetical protein
MLLPDQGLPIRKKNYLRASSDHSGLSDRELDAISWYALNIQERASILFWQIPSGRSWKSLGSVIASTMG